MHHYYLRLVLALILSLFSFSASSKNSTDEWLYFVGLQNSQWKVFIRSLENDGFQVLQTSTEPRGIYFNAKARQLFYIGTAGNLRRLNLTDQKDEVILKVENKQGYAQPFVDSQSGKIFMMYMPEGKSSQSDIAVLNGSEVTSVVRQLSSQFEPVVHHGKWLYYGHVHCLTDCGHIIREVWRKNLVSGESEQITLTGSITRQHVISPQGTWLYFSSNKAGRYYIWRQSLGGGPLEQLTKGSVHDSSPAIDQAENLYFIRRLAAGKAELLRQQPDGTVQSLNLPKGVSDIRNLRINH